MRAEHKYTQGPSYKIFYVLRITYMATVRSFKVTYGKFNLQFALAQIKSIYIVIHHPNIITIRLNL
jgi:hypothetical protein